MYLRSVLLAWGMKDMYAVITNASNPVPPRKASRRTPPSRGTSAGRGVAVVLPTVLSCTPGKKQQPPGSELTIGLTTANRQLLALFFFFFFSFLLLLCTLRSFGRGVRMSCADTQSNISLLFSPLVPASSLSSMLDKTCAGRGAGDGLKMEAEFLQKGTWKEMFRPPQQKAKKQSNDSFYLTAAVLA